MELVDFASDVKKVHSGDNCWATMMKAEQAMFDSAAKVQVWVQ